MHEAALGAEQERAVRERGADCQRLMAGGRAVFLWAWPTGERTRAAHQHRLQSLVAFSIRQAWARCGASACRDKCAPRRSRRGHQIQAAPQAPQEAPDPCCVSRSARCAPRLGGGARDPLAKDPNRAARVHRPQRSLSCGGTDISRSRRIGQLEFGGRILRAQGHSEGADKRGPFSRAPT